MALLDERSARAVKQMFTETLSRPVHVELYAGTANPETVDFSRQLLGELNALDGRVTWSEKPLDDAARALGLEASPTLVIGRELGYRVEYWGAPLGLEAEGFLETLGLVSSGKSGLSDESRELLALVDRPVRLYSFVTPTCPYCPRSVKLNHQIAIERPGQVRSIAVEAEENPELSRKYRVSSVPQQLVNEDLKTVTVGAQPEAKIVRQALEKGVSDPASLSAIEQALRAAKTTFVDAPSKPLEVSDATFDEALAKYPLLVVDFWAEWCGPCRMVGPVVSELAHEMQGKVAFGKLDTEANQDTAARYNVSSIPTLIVFRNGQEVDRLVGARPKKALQSDIERHLVVH